MNRLQPMLYLITTPSLRTYLVVDTPTLVVCGAMALPTSAPTEFSEGNSRTGAPRILATDSWTAPNSALDEVLLPDRPTAIQPRMGDSKINGVPTLEKPLAKELAMPE